MKKLMYFAAMALMVAGCTEDYKDWTVQTPDTTPDEAVTVSASIADVPAIDFATVDPEGEVQLFAPDYSSSSQPDSVVYTAVIYNADKSENVEMPATAEGKVSAALFKSTVQGFYGKQPERNQVPALFIARVYNGGIVTKEIHETTLDVTIPYHGKPALRGLAVPGSHQDWQPADYSQALYETDPDNNPNVFSGYIYMPAGTAFKFADGSWDANWGSSDGATLVANGDNITASEAGCYYITVDLNALTYTMELRNWSLVGDAVGGWEADVDLQYSKDNNIYYATYDFTGSGEFKFRANHDWTYNLGGDKDGEEGDLIQDGANISAAALSGTYSVTLTFEGGYPVYSIVEGADVSKLKFLSLPGSMNGWAADTRDNIIVLSGSTYAGWIHLSADDEFKIADGSWAVNWGSADLATLVADGSNIKPGVEGIYRVEANIDALTLSVTRQSWYIIGTAVGGWDDANDVAMTWDADRQCLSAEVDLAADELKFRADHGWDINLGGTEDELGQNGANLSVAAAGKYRVQLYLQTTFAHPAPYCVLERID